MKKTVMILVVVLAVCVGMAFMNGAFAQSSTDLEEKAKAAGESMKEKMGKSGDQKAAPAATPEQQTAAPGKTERPPKVRPCKEIVDICKKAGFVAGEGRKGDGLYWDCVNPIMQHKTVVPNATKPLPAVDPNLVAQCHKGDPSFGAGPVGSPKHK
jgi:hypothetical protein